MVNLSVSVDFERYFFASLMVDARNYLGKRALTQDFEDLKPVKNVVIQNHYVISLFVIQLSHR